MPDVIPSAGTFCWVELSTGDRRRAFEFYRDLFGWNANEMPMGPDDVYVMLEKNGRNAAALYQEKKQGISPHWSSYIAVASADASAEKAKSLGGSVLAGPFDVMDVGRMAFVADPQGAVFALWEPKKPRPFPRDEPGTLCWNELMTPDGDSARKFYSALFGWTLKVSPDYTEIHLGTLGIGGMLEMKGDHFKGIPPHWMPYFAVENCDTSVAKAKSLGASIRVPPQDIPNVGRFSVIGDPQGASFAVFQIKMGS